MATYVTSADGTRIAWERYGDGRPVILIGGLLCDRARTRSLARSLAEQLGDRWSVVNYDRRGRGESSDTPPYAVDREIDDLRALVTAVGGIADAYGHSSGAGLLLRAAAAGLPLGRIVLHEPPYGLDEHAEQARHLAVAVAQAVREGRRGDAIRLFMAGSGLPDEVIDGMAGDSTLVELASTMPYDFEVMNGFEGGLVPIDLAANVTQKVLVVLGKDSADFFTVTGRRLAAALPAGEVAFVAAEHDQPERAVTAVVSFLTAGRE